MRCLFRWSAKSILLLPLVSGCSVYDPDAVGPASYGTVDDMTSTPDDGADDDAGEGGDSSDGAPATCASVEAQLSGVWITPEDAVVEPNGFYATLELDATSFTGRVDQFAGGAMQTTEIVQWRTDGQCDQLHFDYGTGWLTEYSDILELTAESLELQATDGSYYGQRSRYRKSGSGGDTCTSCQSDADCSGGRSCLTTDEGQLCLPSDCSGCFALEQSCDVTAVCSFIECSGGNPTSTCGINCEASECDAGQACVDTTMGLNCLPPQCQGCIDKGQLCDYSGEDCSFAGCSGDPPPNTCGANCEALECADGQGCFDTGTGLNCLPVACGDCIDMGMLCDYTGACEFIECTP